MNNDELKKEKICDVCGKTYSSWGNNAYPLEGKCCDECNTNYVLKLRAFQMIMKENFTFIEIKKIQQTIKRSNGKITFDEILNEIKKGI